MADREKEPHPPASRRHRAGHVVRGVAIDLTPLRRSRDFRLLYAGEIVTTTGTQITLVALLFQVAHLTDSPAAVGLIGLFQVVPLMFGTIIGGPLIDRHDRRRLLTLTQLLLAVGTAVLLATTFLAAPPLWLLYGAAAFSSFVAGVDVPTRTALTPNLVGKDQLPAAIALTVTMWSFAMIVGPAVGGILVATAGLAWAYAADLATYIATIVLLLLIRSPNTAPGSDGAEGASMWSSIKEGLAYLKGRRVLTASFGIDVVAMTFGLPEALFPFLAATQFHRGPAAAGFLFSSVAVGGLIGSLTSGWTGRIKHQGRAVIWAVTLWGACIAVFGLVDTLWVGLLLLALAGGADVISAVFRATILQSSVPDDLRGRLSGIHFFVVAGGPRLGYLEAGIVAQLFTPLISVVSGGLLTMAGAGLIALFVPEFRKYHAGGET